MDNVPKSLTAAAGEYYVAFLLSKLGYAVGLTGCGTPRVDLLVTNLANAKSIAIQVKTMRQACFTNRADEVWWKWRVGKAVYEGVSKNFYWAFVDLQEDKPATTPDVYFIRSSALVSELARYLDPSPKPPSPPKDVWFWIEEPDATQYRYRDNPEVIRRELE